MTQKIQTSRPLDVSIGNMNVQNVIGADLMSKLEEIMQVVCNLMSGDEVIHF